MAKFFDTLGKGDSDAAIKGMLATVREKDLRTDLDIKLSVGLQTMSNRVGKLVDYDVVIDRQVTTRLAFVCIFAHFERQPAKFEFTFYYIDGAWRFYNTDITLDVNKEVRNAVLYDYQRLQEESKPKTGEKP